MLKKKLPIIFVGMPGCGKSTIARLLSEKLNLPFVDTDQVFQVKFSKTPNEIISLFGEMKFREMESQVLNDIRSNKKIILATGGGLPCFYNQMETLNNWGTTIFLDLEPMLLAERLNNDQTRPLLKNNLLQKLNLLHQSRLPIYQKAHIIVPANMELNELIEKVLVELR